MKRGIEFWVSENGVCLLEGWARNGKGMYRIARSMGLSTNELHRLMAENEVIGRALSKRKEIVDLEVERALLNKALAGDVRACDYWMKYRKGQRERSSSDKHVGMEADAEIEGLLDEAGETRAIGG